MLHEISDGELLHELERRGRASLSARGAAEDQSPKLLVSRQMPGSSDAGEEELQPARKEILSIENSEEEEWDQEAPQSPSFRQFPQAAQEEEFCVEDHVANRRAGAREEEKIDGGAVLSAQQYAAKQPKSFEAAPCASRNYHPPAVIEARAPSNGSSNGSQGRFSVGQLEALAGTTDGAASNTSSCTSQRAQQEELETTDAMKKAALAIERAVRNRLARLTLDAMRQRRARLAEQEAMAQVTHICLCVSACLCAAVKSASNYCLLTLGWCV